LKREQAIAILKEIVANQVLKFNWVSLVNGKTGGYELHIKPEIEGSTRLKPIAEEHNLSLKEVNGVLIIYREHNGFQ
jgi:hypothetical protein